MEVLTTSLKSDLQEVSARLAKGSFGLDFALNKCHAREHNEPQALPESSENEEQHQVSSEVSAHHAKPVDCTQCSGKADARDDRCNDLSGVLLIQSIYGRCIEGARASQIRSEGETKLIRMG